MDSQVTEYAESIFTCGADGGLIGILCSPQPVERSAGRAGIVLINAGNAHRAGPNRVYVRLSRSLAEEGFACLRFDLSGVGDSPSRTDGRPYREYAPLETSAVLDDLEARLGLKRFILLGICAGADIAFDTACADERVAGLVLVNGAFVEGEAFAAAYHKAHRRTLGRYYAKRLLSPGAWMRFFTMQSEFWRIAGRALKTRLSTAGPRATGEGDAPSAAVECRRKWSLLARRGIKVLLLFAEGSVFWDMFRREVSRTVDAVYPKEAARIVLQKAADHTLTLLSAQKEIADTITSWLREAAAGGDKG